MKIAKEDYKVLMAFLEREAYDYKHMLDEDEQKACAILTMNQITSELIKLKQPADFVIVVSNTSLGQTCRELRLTPVEWDHVRCVTVLLPPWPVPRGKCNVYYSDNKGQKLR